MYFHPALCVLFTVFITSGETQQAVDIEKVRQYLSKVPTVTECSGTEKIDHFYGLCNYYGIKYFITCVGVNRKIRANIGRNGGNPRMELIETDNIPGVKPEEEVKFHPFDGQVFTEFGNRDYPYSLNFLDWPLFFDPLKRHLNALAVLFEDYCQDSKDPLKFPIEIDTALINPVFECGSKIVELSTDKQANKSDDFQTYVLDAEKSIQVGYDRQDCKFVWRNENGDWKPIDEAKDTWKAVIIAKRDTVGVVVHNAKTEEIRFYLSDFESVLKKLWSETVNKSKKHRARLSHLFKETLSLQTMNKFLSRVFHSVKRLGRSTASLRVGEDIIMRIEGPITSGNQDPDHKGKIKGNIRVDEDDRSSEDIYVWKDGIYGDGGTKLQSLHNYYIKGTTESSDDDDYVEQYAEFEDIRMFLITESYTIQDHLKRENDTRKVVRVQFVYKEKFVLKTTFAVNQTAYLLQNTSILRKLPSDKDPFIVLARPDSGTKTWVLGTIGRTSAKRWIMGVFAVRLEPYSRRKSTRTGKYTQVATRNNDWTVEVMKKTTSMFHKSSPRNKPRRKN